MLTRGQPYQLQDLDGRLISHADAKKMIKTEFRVPDQVRAKARARGSATNRAKLTRTTTPGLFLQ